MLLLEECDACLETENLGFIAESSLAAEHSLGPVELLFYAVA